MTRLHRRITLLLRRWESGSEYYAEVSRVKRAIWRILGSLLLAASLPALDVLGVDLTADDKRNHFVLGAASSAIGLLILDRIKPDAPWHTRIVVGLASAAVVGAVKELADSRDPDHCAEVDDFTATTIGGAAVSFAFCWEF